MIIIVWLFNYLFCYYLGSVCYHYSHLWHQTEQPHLRAARTTCV